MRTIAIVNRKGGCGKSTLAVGLAATLGELDYRVLLMDLDPQGSASSWLGAGPRDSRDLFEAFLGTRQLVDLVEPSRAPNVDLIAASSWLVTAERNLQVDLAIGAIRAFEWLPRQWDFVLIDCPPTLGYLASAALCGCHEALLPTEPHELDLSGIESVLDEMDRVRGRLNPGLRLTGIVVDRFTRTNHARDVLADLRAAHGDAILGTMIRDSVRVPEAAAAGLPVTSFAPNSPVAADIRAVAEEVLRRDPERPAMAAASGPHGWRGLLDRLVGAQS
jgi:chromosome partitioning protein